MNYDDFNPDGMTIDDLRQWETYLHDTEKAARELFPTRGVCEAQSICIKLWCYCGAKIHAMKMRVAGLINVALELEAQCDSLYMRLPKEVRW